MQQQCVHFHTNKELNAAEDILKNEGMEIIIQSNFAHVTFNELTDEEKKSYMIEVEKELEDQFKFTEDTLKLLEKVMKFHDSSKKLILESFNLMKNGHGMFRPTKTYAEYSDKIRLLGSTLFSCSHSLMGIGDPIEYSSLASRRTRISQAIMGSIRTRNSQVTMGSIHCSLLIAKKGNNIVRYLSFKRDPILTITGPEANSLKSTLESKF